MSFMDWFKSKPEPAKVRKVVRRYEAARPTRIAGGFGTTTGHAVNEILRGDLRGLIAHCRQQSENNDYLKAYFEIIDRNVLGPQGIRLQANARERDGRPDKRANDQLEEGFRKWGEFGTPTVCGTHSWRSAQGLITRTTARDGNILIRQFEGKNLNEFGYQIQLLEVDHLDLEMNQTLNDGGRIIMGVEVDRFQRVRAYHLFTTHPGETSSGLPRERERVPADKIIHVFKAERCAQALGVPWAYTALRRLNLLRGYEEAAMTAARAGASKMGFFEKTESDTLDPDLIDDDEETEGVSLIEDLEPGTIETLPDNYKFQGFDPGYPNGEMEPFMKVALRGAAAGLGVAYSSLANDLEKANFSSLRAGLGEERDEWRNKQRFFWETYHNRVYRGWLRSALLFGAVNLPFAKIDKFENVRWRPRGWQPVNPQQESTSNRMELEDSLRSPQQIVGERGQDLDEVYEEIAAAQTLAKELGIEVMPKSPTVVGEPAE